MSLKSRIAVSHNPVGLLNISSTGFQTQKFEGLTSPEQVARVDIHDVGHEAFVSQG